MGFTKALMDWHAETVRDFPWHGERDPYRIWVSEVMLQQTRAETVIRYYGRFLEQFPTVHSLADAPLERVLKCWEGMGYYSRAKNLHCAAQIVSREMDGQLPESTEALLKLPGVGKYTAAALASVVFGRRELAVDGNVQRALARILGIEENVTTPTAKKALLEGGQALMSADHPGDFNQAIMGLGSMVCTPKNPDCARCPVSAYCEARKAGLQAALPVLPPKIEKRIERRAVALVFANDRVLVRRRPNDGLLGGLWEFPNFVEINSAAALTEALGELGAGGILLTRLPPTKHIFTHLVWEMWGYQYENGALGEERNDLRFVDLAEMGTLTIPVAMKLYLGLAQDRLGGRK